MKAHRVGLVKIASEQSTTLVATFKILLAGRPHPASAGVGEDLGPVDIADNETKPAGVWWD